MINDRELQKLIKNIRKLPEKLNKSIVSLGTKAAAKTVQKAAQSNVVGDIGGHSDYYSHDMGDLEDAIVVKKTSKRSTKRNTVMYKIAIKLDGSADFANYVEFGSKMHSPQPFMTPAYENNGNQAIEAMKAYMKRRFDQAVKKGLV